jgi:uncharacterized membrane protein YedE/YeeE
MNALIAGLSGLVFGIGLIASGMTDPFKVKGFLDLAGAWDPSLGLEDRLFNRPVSFPMAPRTRHPMGLRRSSEVAAGG